MCIALSACSEENASEEAETTTEAVEGEVENTTSEDKAALLTRVWILSEVSMDEQIVPQERIEGVTYAFSKAMQYHISGDGKNEKGTWKLSFDETRLQFTREGSAKEDTFDYSYSLASLTTDKLILTVYEEKDTYGFGEGMKTMVFKAR